MSAAGVAKKLEEIRNPKSELLPLETALAQFARDGDPFKRLQYLFERYQILYEELPHPVNEMTSRAAERSSLESVLREEYELHCHPRFPNNLLEELRKEKPGYLWEIAQCLDERWREFSQLEMLRCIEQWLGFRRHIGQAWFTEGVVKCQERLRRAQKAVEGAQKPNIFALQGPVMEAYTLGELLIRQIFSFYGRFLFGRDYLPVICERLARDQSGGKGEHWAAKALRLQEEGRNPSLGTRIDLVMMLQRWLEEWGSKEEYPEAGWEARFKKVFDREAIFEPNQGEEKPSEIRVIVKDSNVIAPRIRKANREPLWIQQLRALKRLRPCYAHDQDSFFLRPENFDNVKRGAQLIIDAFIDLWQQLHLSVYPEVAIIKRLLQVKKDVIRVDYITENSPERLRHLRLPRSAVPDYLSDTMGEQVFFHCLPQDHVAKRQSVIIPVEEGLVDEKGICSLDEGV